MSSRALRRLQQLDFEQSGEKIPKSDEDVDSNPDGDSLNTGLAIAKKKHKNQRKSNNLFELLTEKEEDEVKEEDEENIASSEVKNNYQSGKIQHEVKSTKKKKKRNKKKDKETPLQKHEEPEDDVEASLREVNRILGDLQAGGSMDDGDQGTFSAKVKPLLHIDYRHLNPEMELKRMFGAEIVRSEHQQRKRQHRNRPLQRSSRLVQPKDTWHSTGGSGLSMKYLGEQEGFVFEHSPVYQKIQHQFSDAVESGRPEYIIAILRAHPYHIDALLQMAEFQRANEDVQTAAETIEKALYGMECAFHPLFNLASGNCYLNYRYPENRSFYLCLFKHILNLGRRGCNRTAFEFCKLLLSLDPTNDPLDCMSMIDYFALRAQQYEHLVRLDTEVLTSKAMKHVPNFAMSIPLAYFKLAVQNGRERTTADSILQDSLLFFPMMLTPLLDECSVQPDKLVKTAPFNNTAELHDNTCELQRMIMLYVKRCQPCWKEAEVIAWLEENVKAVIEIVRQGTDKRLEEYEALRKKRFRKPPLSLVRHYFLSEIQGLGLPRHFLSSPVLSHDPFPPPDSIISYTRPASNVRPTVASQDQSGVLRSFLQSLLPTYNPYEPVNVVARQQHRDEEDDAEGARGGNAIPQQIQQSVQAIMQAMRQLLNEQFNVGNNPEQGNGREDQPELDENDREWEEEDGLG